VKTKLGNDHYKRLVNELKALFGMASKLGEVDISVSTRLQ